MSGYVRVVDVNVEFGGHQVRIALRPLSRADLFKLRALMPNARPGVPPNDQETSESFQFYAGRLRDYIVSCSGIVDAAGQEVPIEEWVDGAYFIDLIGQVMEQHMEKAMPRDPLSFAEPPVASSGSV